ncbi:MAG: ABC transporter ATP-binding protein [Anaerolineaceae bacterium]|nr:ABC transporter ATP-binding protein [Anaerolineaceae bacterium]
MSGTVLSYQSGRIIAERRKSARVLVEDISFSLQEGESLALIGETGSGKTMTALSLMGLLPENVTRENGETIFCGENLTRPQEARKKLGVEIVYIPQNGMEFLNPSRKVKDQLFDNLEKLGISGKNRQKAALEKLQAAGLQPPEDFMEKYPFQLSGGEAQRVTIAISACSNAKLLIADEPTNGLDPETKARFLQHIRHLFPKAARILITHDITAAEQCSNVLVLCGGKFIERGPAETVLNRPKHPYTRALRAALAVNGMKETPVMRNGASGCPFYNRCPDARTECRGEIPLQRDDACEWRCVL